MQNLFNALKKVIGKHVEFKKLNNVLVRIHTISSRHFEPKRNFQLPRIFSLLIHTNKIPALHKLHSWWQDEKQTPTPNYMQCDVFWSCALKIVCKHWLEGVKNFWFWSKSCTCYITWRGNRGTSQRKLPYPRYSFPKRNYSLTDLLFDL